MHAHVYVHHTHILHMHTHINVHHVHMCHIHMQHITTHIHIQVHVRECVSVPKSAEPPMTTPLNPPKQL